MRRRLLVLGAFLLTGCGATASVELSLAASPTLLSEAAARHALTRAPVVYEFTPALEALVALGEYEDRWHRYRVRVGASLRLRLPQVARALLGSGQVGDPLVLRYESPLTSCAFTRDEARAEVGVTVIVRQGDLELGRRRLTSAGSAPLTNAFSFDVERRLRVAFERALARLDVQQLLFLASLELPRAQGGRPAPSAGGASGRPQEVDLEQIEELVQIGDGLGAERALTTLVQRDPTNALFFQRRGALRLNLGRDHEALADCFRALELDDQLAAAFVTRAMIWARRGERQRALADCDAALAAPHPESIEAHVRRLRTRVQASE
ncbi:MAG: hypothetical protein JKY65_26255 [Planctomycetes bacterium]|nr:hypothetical protein [Planctomycetota bacterium]